VLRSKTRPAKELDPCKATGQQRFSAARHSRSLGGRVPAQEGGLYLYKGMRNFFLVLIVDGKQSYQLFCFQVNS